MFRLLWVSYLPYEDLLEISSILICEPITMIQDYWDKLNNWIQVMGINVDDNCMVNGKDLKEHLNCLKK